MLAPTALLGAGVALYIVDNIQHDFMAFSLPILASLILTIAGLREKFFYYFGEIFFNIYKFVFK